jgi:nicotinate-nucleotide adenylyltransferase
VGHLILLRYWLNETALEVVWLIVSPQNPHKSPQELAPVHHRLEMARLATQDEPRLFVSDVECHLPLPSYTIQTLKALDQRFPKHQWKLFIGSDAFREVPTWQEGDKLLSEYDFWVYPRRNVPIKTENPRVTLFSQAPQVEISATQVRKYLRQGQSIRFLVPAAVETYIRTHRLYEGASDT